MPHDTSCTRCGQPVESETGGCDCGEANPSLTGRRSPCLHCDGQGRVPSRSLEGFFSNQTTLRWVPCDPCDGRGWLPDDDEAEASIGPFHAYDVEGEGEGES